MAEGSKNNQSLDLSEITGSTDLSSKIQKFNSGAEDATTNLVDNAHLNIQTDPVSQHATEPAVSPSNGASATTTLPNQIKSPAINLSPLIDNLNRESSLGEQDSSKASINVSWLRQASQKLHFKKIFSKQNLRYGLVGLVSFIVFAVVFNLPVLTLQLSYLTKPKSTSAPAVNMPVQTVQAPPPAETVPPDPIIIIPKINVNAPVVYEPSQAEDKIQYGLRSGVVHYGGTAVPGERGNVVIVGHSSNDWWQPGNYKFAFVLLDKLAIGDSVQINYQSKKYVYQVTSNKVVAPTDLSVLDPTTDPTLTLITCTPPGTNWKRLIISAKQIEPVPASAPKLVQTAAQPEPTHVQPLPGNAPSLFSQIGNFFSSIVHFFNPSKTSPNSNPSSPHLPDVKSI